MSDEDDDLKIETQKEISLDLSKSQTVGIVNGEAGDRDGRTIVTTESFPSVPKPAATAPMPSAPMPPAPLIKIDMPAPAAPAAPPPTPVPAAAAATTSSIDFNIFAEKTQVQIPSQTRSSITNAGKIATFDDKTVVHGVSPRKKSSAEPVRNIKPAHEVTYNSVNRPAEDMDESQTQSKLQWLAYFKKFEIERKTVATYGGAIAILLVLFHFFFSEHEKPAEPVPMAIAAPAPVTREVSSKAPPIVELPATSAALQPVLRQSSQEFFWHFRGAIEKNQNLGR